MYRYGLLMLAFAFTLASCTKKEDLSPVQDPYQYLKATVDPGAAPAPDFRGSSSTGSSGSNPFHRYGRRHNEGFRDFILSTNTAAGNKQWILNVGDYTGVPGLETFRYYTSLSPLPIARQVDSAEAAGASALVRGTWQYLAEAIQAMESPDFSTATTLFDATDAALLALDPEGTDSDVEHALGVSSVFRHSFALHTGATLDGIDYGSQSWNPTPNLPSLPDARLTIDWKKIIMADAMGFVTSFNWQQALAASLYDLIDQLLNGGYVLSDVFSPAIDATVPFSPVVAGGTMPDR